LSKGIKVESVSNQLNREFVGELSTQRLTRQSIYQLVAEARDKDILRLILRTKDEMESKFIMKFFWLSSVLILSYASTAETGQLSAKLSESGATLATRISGIQLSNGLPPAAWWSALPPAPGVEREIWEARAAFLDSLFYDGKNMPTS